MRKLGYEQRSRAWRYPDRHVIFVGEFIDRGPAQIRSVDIARRMGDAGSALAVMGNHELNAIAGKHRIRRIRGSTLRSHHSPKWGERNRQQHAAFLAEVEHDSALHAELIDWFLTPPLWFDLPALRVGHAVSGSDGSSRESEAVLRAASIETVRGELNGALRAR